MDAIRSSARVTMRENGFFLGMAVLMAATVIGGFGSFALRGQVDVGRAPYWVHVHGAVFMAWTLLFVLQSALVRRGTMALHRRLGLIAVGLGVVMVPLAVLTACMAVRLGRVPPFFPPPVFMALSLLEVAAFALLLTLAIRARRRTDWHRRLMLCTMIALIGPAFGRLLPMPLLGHWAGLSVMGMQLLYLAIAAAYDPWTGRRWHRAYGVGALVIVVEGMGVPLLAATPPIAALVAALGSG